MRPQVDNPAKDGPEAIVSRVGKDTQLLEEGLSGGVELHDGKLSDPS